MCSKLTSQSIIMCSKIMSLSLIILRWAGHVARMEEGRSAIKTLTAKRSLGRHRRRWEDNITMDLEEIGISAGNLVDSAQDRYYWSVINAY